MTQFGNFIDKSFENLVNQNQYIYFVMNYLNQENIYVTNFYMSPS